MPRGPIRVRRVTAGRVCVESAAVADVLVIFGITGDLARKMTFRALYRLERRGLLDCRIIGVARRTDWGHDTLRSRARESIEETVGDFDEEVFKRLSKRLHLVSGDYADHETYHRLKRAMEDAQAPLFYLEIPPSLFSPVVHQLGEAGLTDGARVILEKPFGHDAQSAHELQASLREVLEEDQILRIDHFLGKEPVMDITYLRFANALLEPVWNREHVAYVQVTMGEDFGVEGRGSFYEPGRRPARRLPEPPAPDPRAGGDGAALGRAPRRGPRPQARALPGDAPARPEALRPRPVPRLPGDRGRRPGFRHGDVRRP